MAESGTRIDTKLYSNTRLKARDKQAQSEAEKQRSMQSNDG